LISSHLPLILTLGWNDIRSRYRRSVIGPFWLTISMGVMIACIGLVFGGIFKTPIDEYLPFLAAGIILWTFIMSTINEGCTGFVSAEGIIKQLPVPLFVHVLRVVWRNVLMLAHHIVILPLVLLVMGKSVSLIALLAIPGFVLVVLCLSWLAFFFAIVCARYRDLPQIVANVLQVGFYLTPIIWMPALLPERLGAAILDWNPFYHVLELLRAPLLGSAPAVTSWLVVGIITVVGWGLTLLLFARVKHRIAYWL
jgi:lipopolysaccharide transport system permease protein